MTYLKSIIEFHVFAKRHEIQIFQMRLGMSVYSKYSFSCDTYCNKCIKDYLDLNSDSDSDSGSDSDSDSDSDDNLSDESLDKSKTFSVKLLQEMCKTNKLPTHDTKKVLYDRLVKNGSINDDCDDDCVASIIIIYICVRNFWNIHIIYSG